MYTKPNLIAYQKQTVCSLFKTVFGQNSTEIVVFFFNNTIIVV